METVEFVTHFEFFSPSWSRSRLCLNALAGQTEHAKAIQCLEWNPREFLIDDTQFFIPNTRENTHARKSSQNFERSTIDLADEMECKYSR